jgi:hypothetical protein
LKKKTEDILVKHSRAVKGIFKSCERNMQELSDSIKRPNLRTWALKKEKRCKPKGYIIYSIK